MKHTALLALFAASFVKQALSACVTDGGYAEQGTPCASDCFSFPLTNKIPYVGANTPPTEPVEASGNTFCTTIPFDEYDPTKAGERKFWGFCLCESTNSPTAETTTEVTQSPTPSDIEEPEPEYEEVWLADGAGVGLSHPENVDENGYQPCMLPFTYIDEDGSEQSIEGCASITQVPPFLGGGNDFPHAPKNSSTNTGRWCPINSNMYDIDPPQSRIKERKDWGYCLLTLREIVSTVTPTTLSPTPSLTTVSPTVLPTVLSSSPTLSPTIVSSTLSPTLFPEEPDFYEDENETGSKPPVGTGGGSPGNKASSSFALLAVAFVAMLQVLRN